MLEFEWDEKKNRWLQVERGISFQDIVSAVKNGNVLDFKEDKRQDRYPGQY